MAEPTRYITTHDSSGRSVLTGANDLFFRSFAGGSVSRAFGLSSVPVSITADSDLEAYRSEDGDRNPTSYTLAGQQTTVPGGVNVTYFNLAPGAQTTMHRTLSVDFMVVLDGELEMELDGAEKILLKPGVSQYALSLKFRDYLQHFVNVSLPGLGGTESHNAQMAECFDTEAG